MTHLEETHANRVRVWFTVDAPPDVDNSPFEIVTGVVLAALHEAGLFPESFTVEVEP